MKNDLFIPTERIQFAEGQRLLAQDLRDLLRREAHLRRLHQRSFHDWGIISGLDVSIAAPNRGRVTLNPGMALDSAGREIILAETVTLAVPQTHGEQFSVLVVEAPPDEGSAARKNGDCTGEEHSSIRLIPTFKWLPVEQAEFGDCVPLTAAVLHNRAIRGGLQFRVRRMAQRLVRPRIAGGITEIHQTGWVPADVPDEPDIPGALKAVISTQDAGFSTSPHYFAWLMTDSSEIPTAMAEVESQGTVYELGAFCYLLKMQINEFTFQVFPNTFMPGRFPADPQEAEKRGWHVAWLGIEPVPGGMDI